MPEIEERGSCSPFERGDVVVRISFGWGHRMTKGTVCVVGDCWWKPGSGWIVLAHDNFGEPMGKYCADNFALVVD